MKLLLAGYYGCGNLGDEAILEALIAGIRKHYINADITVLSGNPHDTVECYRVKSVNRLSFFKVLSSIRANDVLILGGGGLLQDITSKRSLRYYLLLIRIAKFFKKKVVLLGQGIGPIKDKGLLKRGLKNVDLVTVRDDGSFKELVRIGVQAKKIVLTADLAFSIEIPGNEKAEKLLELEGIKKCKPRLIGVALRTPIDKDELDEKYRALASTFDRLIKEKDSNIVFLIFRYPEDIDVANKVMGMMKYTAHVLLRQCRPSDMLAAISKMDAVIGMRLHSLIFAAKAKVPCLGLSYDPKVARFQQLIGQPCLDFSAINETTLRSEIDGFLSRSRKESFEVDKLSEKASSNFTLLSECLDNNKTEVLGIRIDNLSMKEAADKIESFLQKRNHNLIVTPNPEMIMASQKDIELRAIVNSAALAPPDGVGLMIAGRILGRKFKGRIPGIDLMLKVVEIAKAKGSRIFLLGGREGVAEAAAKELNAYIAGTFHGYSMNDQLVLDKIKEARPDMLFIGLGSPKQEKWANKHSKGLNVPVVMCIGGSLDVISGRVKRAPAFMRSIGLEWLWRLALEPGRWRRMTALPVFLMKVVGSRYGK